MSAYRHETPNGDVVVADGSEAGVRLTLTGGPGHDEISLQLPAGVALDLGNALIRIAADQVRKKSRRRRRSPRLGPPCQCLCHEESGGGIHPGELCWCNGGAGWQ